MKKVLLGAATLAVLASATQAQDINLSGFASGHVSSALSGTKHRGSGDSVPNNYTKQTDYHTFSKFGLNISSQLDSKWSVQSQVLASGMKTTPGSNDPQWQLYANWLFVAYKLTDDTRVRFGRQLFAAWLNSEVIDVGYMYPYMETPHATYELAPFKSLNGVSIDHTFKLENDKSLKIMAFGGEESLAVPVDGDSSDEHNDYSDIVGTEVSLSGKGYKLRAMGSYYQVETEIKNGSTLVSGPYTNNSVKTYTLGFKYDLDNILILAELGYRKGGSGTRLTHANESVIPTGVVRTFNQEVAAGYVTAGYWFGKFLPHLTLSASNYKSGSVEGKQNMASIAGNYKIIENVMLKTNITYNQSTVGPTHLSAVGHSVSAAAGIDLIF